MKQVEIKNCYFKQYADYPDMRFISGLPMPNLVDGVVGNVRFIGCSFHPACEDFRFENCDFIGCSGAKDLGPINREDRAKGYYIGSKGLVKMPFCQRIVEADKMSPGAKRIIELSEQGGDG